MSSIIPANRLVQGSMSKTDLLLQCQYWASPLVTVPKRDPNAKDPYHLRFGSAYHKTQEIHLSSRGKKRPNIPILSKRFEVEIPRLKDFYERGREFIDDELERLGLSDEEYIVEKKIGYDPYTDTARYLVETGERDYSGRKINELPGTGDLAIVPRDRDVVYVWDWKTGSKVYDSEVNGQLRSLGLGMARIVQRSTAIVTIVRIDDDFLEPVPPATLDARSLDLHRDALRRAISQARSANPFLRPGTHCSSHYCDYIEMCPAHRDPMSLGDEMHSLEDRSRLGVLYARYKAAEKMMEAVGNRFKREIEMNGPFECEDGSHAVLKDASKRTLSKTSIVRALGKVDGLELYDQLVERGCVDETNYMKIDYERDASGRK